MAATGLAVSVISASRMIFCCGKAAVGAGVETRSCSFTGCGTGIGAGLSALICSRNTSVSAIGKASGGAATTIHKAAHSNAIWTAITASTTPALCRQVVGQAKLEPRERKAGTR